MKKLAQDPVFMLGINEISPSPENALLYHPVTPDDLATIELADSIRERGVLEPIVISEDGYIISGHRRHCAARMAGLSEIPCRKMRGIRRGHGEKADDGFFRLLREHNRSRIKSRDELLREAIISVDPEKEHRRLTAYRRRKSKITVSAIEVRDVGRRCEISAAKTEFLRGVHEIIREQEEFWPLSLRQIHYQLLNDPPLIHASKPASRYRNDSASYHRLVDLVTRARHEGWIDYEVIDDPTRPVTTWDVHRNLSSYYGRQVEDLLCGYSRDLLQSQPNHVELIVEKNTLRNIVSPLAAEFCIPLTIGRGQCSTRPLFNIAERYKKSGREKLIILAVSDLDPDGDAIAHSLGQRLRDDFRIRDVAVVKTALTMKQVDALGLPEKFERTKEKSPNYSRYVNTYGTDLVWELEAVDPKTLQKLIIDAIDGVIDRKAYNAEVAQERTDAAHNAAVRELVLQTLREQTGL